MLTLILFLNVLQCRCNEHLPEHKRDNGDGGTHQHDQLNGIPEVLQLLQASLSDPHDQPNEEEDQVSNKDDLRVNI